MSYQVGEAALELSRCYPTLEGVLTLGHRGAVAFGSDGVNEVPGRAVNVEDTTGAGDVFFSAFLAYHLLGKRTPRAAAQANDRVVEWLNHRMWSNVRVRWRENR